MAKKSDNPISLKFLLFLIVIIGVLIAYISEPSETSNKINRDKTFDEMLEYSNNNSYNEYNDNNKSIKTQNTQQLKINNQITKRNTNYSHSTLENQIKIENRNDKNQINNYDESFNKLLDKLTQYPPYSITSVKAIVNQILLYRGYRENTVQVIEEGNESSSKVQTSYIAAYFNIETGCINVNKQALYSLDKKHLIAILAHELDHFEKIAQLCKSVGVEDFITIANKNKMYNINRIFWEEASNQANITNYNSKFYKEAFERYLNQGSIDLVSTYSDLYRLAEHMRNPLELSAYEISDYVLHYYNLPNEDGPIKKLIMQFNEVDWALYNLLKTNDILNNERIAFFDYFFSQAISKTSLTYKEEYNNCIINKDGDLTSFWLMFENNNKSFYSKNKQLTPQTYKRIMSLLKETKILANTQLTPETILQALKYKVNTLLSNIVYPNAIKYIEYAATDYIEIAKKNKIDDFNTELKMILVLLCIENNIYKNSQINKQSLYYLKSPEILNKYYNLNTKINRFHEIYRNQTFQSILGERKKQDPSINESILLQDLLVENSLDVRIKY